MYFKSVIFQTWHLPCTTGSVSGIQRETCLKCRDNIKGKRNKNRALISERCQYSGYGLYRTALLRFKVFLSNSLHWILKQELCPIKVKKSDKFQPTGLFCAFKLAWFSSNGPGDLITRSLTWNPPTLFDNHLTSLLNLDGLYKDGLSLLNLKLSWPGGSQGDFFASSINNLEDVGSF